MSASFDKPLGREALSTPLGGSAIAGAQELAASLQWPMKIVKMPQTLNPRLIRVAHRGPWSSSPEG